MDSREHVQHGPGFRAGSILGRCLSAAFECYLLAVLPAGLLKDRIRSDRRAWAQVANQAADIGLGRKVEQLVEKQFVMDPEGEAESKLWDLPGQGEPSSRRFVTDWGWGGLLSVMLSLSEGSKHASRREDRLTSLDL